MFSAGAMGGIERLIGGLIGFLLGLELKLKSRGVPGALKSKAAKEALLKSGEGRRVCPGLDDGVGEAPGEGE